MSKKPKGIAVPGQVLLRLSDVNMAVYNPRVMPPEKMRALRASLVKHGFVLNLVVQKRGMVLIGGHQRVRAMRELCSFAEWTPARHRRAYEIFGRNTLALSLREPSQQSHAHRASRTRREPRSRSEQAAQSSPSEPGLFSL